MNIIVDEKRSTRIKPIIKWTGGKYEEFSVFNKYIPSFDRYIEPFFGGGGVFFALQPSSVSLINDKSNDLINFYSLVHSHSFEVELLQYVEAWESAGRFAKHIIPGLLPLFKSYINNQI